MLEQKPKSERREAGRHRANRATAWRTRVSGMPVHAFSSQARAALRRSMRRCTTSISDGYRSARTTRLSSRPPYATYAVTRDPAQYLPTVDSR